MDEPGLTYRSAKLSISRDKDKFCEALEETRLRWALRIIGYVVMPEHVHLLVSEPRETKLSVAVQMLKQTVSRQFRAGGEPFWMPRYYDFNIYSVEKISEKLDYMHFNPVKRGLVYEAIDWRWSSARFYMGLDTNPVTVEPLATLAEAKTTNPGAPSYRR